MSEEHHEAVPYRVFAITWLLLLALTATTVTVSRIPLGLLNIVAALGIASAKSGLVIFIFMHLRHESRVFKLFFFLALLILATFVGMTFFDVLYR